MPNNGAFLAFAGTAAIAAAVVIGDGQTNMPPPTAQKNLPPPRTNASPAPPHNGMNQPQQAQKTSPPPPMTQRGAPPAQNNAMPASANAAPAPPANIPAKPPQQKPEAPALPPSLYSGTIPASALLRVPVTGIIPGAINTAPKIRNPLADDPDAAQRGMRDFNAFNCSGCHAANGAGGMGPSLSNDKWIYRSSPANIYLTIVQGRAKGMPAWGAMLPDRVVWELVSYIKSISHPPDGHFGKTTSLSPLSPAIEQVPAERQKTTNPWNYTEPFSKGQKPASSP